MLNANDIIKLTEYQAEVFATKKDIGEVESRLGSKIDNLQTSVDGIAKIVKDQGQEMMTHNHKIEQIDDFLGKAAPKLGLDYKK